MVSAVVFILFYVFPSADPAQLRAGRQANQDQIQAIRESLGLDKSVLTQFWIYIKGVFTPLDLPGTDAHGPFYFGHSYQSNADVKDVILSDLPATVMLVIGAVVIWLAIAIPVGIISAIKSRSLLDRTTMITTLAFISAPVFWLGLVALYLFAQDVGVFPIFPGIGSYAEADDFIGRVGSMLLPWFVLAAATAAIYARYLRSQMIDVMGEDYIRTARAKGLPENRVIMKHALRSRGHPDHHAARARCRGAAGRQRDPHRDGVQHPRRRRRDLQRDQAVRPADDPGDHACSAPSSSSPSTLWSTSPTPISILG